MLDGELRLLLRALTFAARKHRDQRRKDAEASPYINHPIALADVLANEGGVYEVNVLCAALLHDTIEDTATTREELAGEFGESIAAIVAAVSDDKSLSKEARKRAQVEYAVQLKTGRGDLPAELGRAAMLVKVADKICNLRDVAEHPPAGWDTARRCDYFDWAKRVIDGMRGVHAPLEAAFDAAYAKRPE